MIRVVTLDEFDPKALEKFCSALYTAFGVGCEHSGQVRYPAGMTEPYDPHALLEAAQAIRSYQDDKILYLTRSKLKDRNLPSGVAPTHGVVRNAKDRALLSIHPIRDLEANLGLATRHAMHQVGHLWELHHCLDPRCAMFPPWTPSFAQAEPFFCNFCRDKSEQKIRLAKS